MIPIEELLKLIADDQPAGADCGSGDLSLTLYQLEEMARGTPGQERVVDGQMIQDPPTEPKWRDVQASALELLRQSKHLRVLTILSLSALRLEGLAGLRDGFSVLAGWLKPYWPSLWPALDPADNNDPQERLNLLSELGGETFVRYLDEVVVGQSPQMGRATLADLRASRGVGTPAEGAAGLTPAQVDAILRDTDPEHLKGTRQVVGEIRGLLGDINQFCSETLGAGQSPDWQVLSERCQTLDSALAPYAGGGAPVVEAGGEAAPGAPHGATAAKAGGGSKGIASRNDVVTALEEICRYYQQNEPSSPVPLLLRRAQRLAKMDFVAALNELLPDAVGQLKTIAGQLPETGEKTG